MDAPLPARKALLEMYAVMVRIKTCDDLMRSAIMRGQATLFYFPVRGQEAIPAAMSQAVRPTDYLVATYRGLHDEIGKGVPMPGLLAEILGRSTGLSGGKGGGMHICDPESGVMLTSGIVGSGLPLAVGLATASQIKKDGRVTVCSFGDGATNTGAFHEAMNLAAVWEAPVAFLCQNNRYAETTRTEETYRCETLVTRAEAYGMPAARVDGYDPVAVYQALAPAVERARAGDGPSFVEAECYRYFGHYFGDTMPNVPQGELQAEMAKDPVPRYAAWLVELGSASADDVQTIAEGAEQEARKAFEEAMAAAPPEPETALSGAYSVPVTIR